MSKRFNEINEKDVDEFNEAEENQNTKRKTELDVNLIHSYIATEAVSHVNKPCTDNGRTVAVRTRQIFK